jgi:sortase A
MMRRVATRLCAVALIAGGGALLLQAAYIPAKALVAQALLERAWDAARSGDADARPWPWADIAPVARLEIARLRWGAIVLGDSSGEALAFGPGHMPNTAAIGTPGTAVIAGHRDTHFGVLRELRAGDRVTATTQRGAMSFRVSETRVVRADASGLDVNDGGASGARLALVTCYPFSGVLNSPWRYVVIAEREPDTPPSGRAVRGTPHPASAFAGVTADASLSPASATKRPDAARKSRSRSSASSSAAAARR